MVYASGVSDTVISLCTEGETIASALSKREAAKSSSSVHEVWLELYPKPFVLKRLVNRFTIKHDLYHGRGDPTKEDLDRAEKCGKFPYRPSDLFLKMFSDVLLCLERDPLSGICAPSLIGTSGVMPLSIISVIPDIMQHYYDCIVLAKQEVILATNYWQPSNSVDKISNSLRELSKRAAARGQKNLPVKIMWDRGELSQAVDNHAMVNQEGREALKLPKLDEIPNLILEVINFHRPIMGTFHAKFLIVDRKVALVNSNNIQDRPNLEMMVHLEGPVVESFYDIFLYSWHHKLTPVLPCLMQPPPETNLPGRTSSDFLFGPENPYLANIELVKSSRAARAMLNMEKVDDDKLAELRERAEKERAGQAFNPQAKFQAVLGALSENRRGSFGSDTNAQAGTTSQQPRQTTLKFSDVVMQAYDKRRKSFQGTASGRPALSTVPSMSAAESAPQQYPPTIPNGTRSSEEPSMINWQANTSSEALQTVDEKLATSTYRNTQRDEAQATNSLDTQTPASEYAGLQGYINGSTSEQALPNGHAIGASNGEQAPSLPALNLPNPTFDSPSVTPGPTPNHSSTDIAQINVSRELVQDAGHLHPHPPTNGDRALSPILSERSSVSHPDASTDNLPRNNVDTPQPVDGLPESSGPNGLGLEHLDPPMHPVQADGGATAAGDVASRTPPALRSPTLSGLGKDGRTRSDLSQNGSTLSKRRSFKGGINTTRTRSKSGSIRSGVNGSALSGPPGTHTPRQRALSTVLNAGALSEAWSTVEDGDVLDEFNPHTLHKAHEPFPIAMVNRKPHGLPGHQDIRVPQDAAWLAGFRYAEKSVFIQTPTFNAKPIIAAALDACRRGIQVTIYVDLGFNDKGESMPFQGGTNEEVVEKMYKELNRTNHQKNLHVYWYTGKDQVRPLNAVKKQRNCHVKFMQVDDQVGIQGNGNQDTQSWYHSCEVNIMVDSKHIVADWMAAIHRQQNTEKYGRVDDDGIWRDKATGKTPAEMETWENEKRRQAELEANGGSTPKRSSSRISFSRRNSGKDAASLRGSPANRSSLREGSTATI